MDLAAEQYYKKIYPHDEVLRLLARRWRGSSTLPYRELCIESVDDAYIRYQSAESVDELRRLFRQKRVLKFHSGAVYDQPMAERQRKKQQMMVPCGRELLFEIDANDYALGGVDATDIDECDAAWPLVAFGMAVLQYILAKHFDFKHIMIVYSGRRGAHLTVHDERAFRLTDEERTAIVKYVQPPSESKDGTQGHPRFGNMMNEAFFGDLWKRVVLPFWEDHCIKPRQKNGMGLLDTVADRSDFVCLAFKNTSVQAQLQVAIHGCATPLDTFRAIQRWVTGSQYPETDLFHLQSAVLAHVWFPLDTNVSIGLGHLGKHPFSLHPKTGRLCVPVGSDPSRFDPKRDAPRMVGVVDGVHTDIKAMQRGLERFRRFVETLSTSSAEIEYVAPKTHAYKPSAPQGGTKRPPPYRPNEELWDECALRSGPYGPAGFALAR